MTEWNAETAEWYAGKYGEYATNRIAVGALVRAGFSASWVQHIGADGVSFTMSVWVLAD